MLLLRAIPGSWLFDWFQPESSEISWTPRNRWTMNMFQTQLLQSVYKCAFFAFSFCFVKKKFFHCFFQVDTPLAHVWMMWMCTSYRSAPHLQLGGPRREFTIQTWTPEGTNWPAFSQKGLFVIFMFIFRATFSRAWFWEVVKWRRSVTVNMKREFALGKWSPRTWTQRYSEILWDTLRLWPAQKLVAQAAQNARGLLSTRVSSQAPHCGSLEPRLVNIIQHLLLYLGNLRSDWYKFKHDVWISENACDIWVTYYFNIFQHLLLFRNLQINLDFASGIRAP